MQTERKGRVLTETFASAIMGFPERLAYMEVTFVLVIRHSTQNTFHIFGMLEGFKGGVPKSVQEGTIVRCRGYWQHLITTPVRVKSTQKCAMIDIARIPSQEM